MSLILDSNQFLLNDLNGATIPVIRPLKIVNVFVGPSRAIPIVQGDKYAAHTRGDTTHSAPLVTVTNTFNIFVGTLRLKLAAANKDNAINFPCLISLKQTNIPNTSRIFIGN